jgi:putative sigma-54 modulation protein
MFIHRLTQGATNIDVMKINVNAVHFTADQKLITFINEKVNKLELFYDNIIGVEVFLRLDKEHAHDNKIAEVKIHIPGKELFAKKQCKSFEEATDLAVEALRKQVKKHKEKVM